MSYHEFLAYLYDHETSRHLAVGIAQAVAEAPHCGAQHIDSPRSELMDARKVRVAV